MNIIRNLSIASILLLLPVRCLSQDTLGINTDSLCIDIRYMMPQRYSGRAVTDFSLCLKNDTVISYLPYIGRVYQPTFGDTDGMNFSQPIINKSIKKSKKDKLIINFSCKNNTVNYDFTLEVYPEGSAYVYVILSNADPIDYRGDWK